MSSLWRLLADVTYPIVAYTTVRIEHLPSLDALSFYLGTRLQQDDL